MPRPMPRLAGELVLRRLSLSGVVIGSDDGYDPAAGIT
jgi:hypothetical protein